MPNHPNRGRYTTAEIRAYLLLNSAQKAITSDEAAARGIEGRDDYRHIVLHVPSWMR